MAGIRVKKRVFSGCVCEQQVWTAPAQTRDIKNAEPHPPRFKNEEDREKHRLGISRRKFIRLVNANFSPTSLYSTLTFDKENEVHTFEEAKQLRNNYYRRLIRACPDAKIVIVMGRGKATRRIHLHLITEGIPKEVLLEKWKYGQIVDCEPLRSHNWYEGKDHGQDYTGLAVYLFNHWTEEQGGHRWKASRNLREPEAEDTKPIKREYTKDKPPRAPKGYIYIGCDETSYGCATYIYIVDPGPDPRRQHKKKKL